MAKLPGADVCIVGTGIVGLAAGWELLKRGATVVLVGPQPDQAQTQASLAAGAMLSVFSEVEIRHTLEALEVEVPERIKAIELWRSWIPELCDLTGRTLDLIDGAYVVATLAELPSLNAIVAAARHFGHAVEERDAKGIAGFRPNQPPAACIYLPTEASVDSSDLISALASAVNSSRRSSWQHTDAKVVKGIKGQARVIYDGGEVTADRVLLAAGASIPALLADNGRPLGLPAIFAGRGVGITIDTVMPPEVTIRTPNRDFSCGLHMVPRSNGFTYLGSTNRLSLPITPGHRPTLDEISSIILDVAAEFNPNLEDAEFVAARVGYRPFTLDRLPIVGPLADPALVVASGTFRSGVLLAPRIATLVADELLEPGTISGHQFNVLREMVIGDPESIIDAATHYLISVICGSGGHIAPWSVRRLTQFLELSLRVILGGSDDTGDAEAMRELWRQAPIEEVLPLLHRLPQRRREGTS